MTGGEGGGHDAEAAARTLRDLTAELRAAMVDAAAHRERADGLAAAFQAVLWALPYAVMALDDGGRVVLWSPRAERMLGVAAADAVGRGLADLDGLGGELADAVTRCLGAGGGETRVRRNGALLHLLCRSLAQGRNPVGDGRVSAVVLVEDPSAG